MALVSIQNVSIAFGSLPVLDSVTLHIEQRERVCLLGPNGAGKSTLLNVCQGTVQPDSGHIVYQSGIRIAGLDQQFPATAKGSVESYISAPDVSTGQVGRALSQMGLDAGADLGTLSGGQKRRAGLARALAAQPDLLLLDEPTNHLDIDTILFLEDFLRRFEGAVLFVTHDRNFLRAMATRIIELDRGNLSNWDCPYDVYLDRKQDMLESEQKQWDNFDKKLAGEEAWIRRGIKARRTRNEGRVRELVAMREERRRRRERADEISMVIQEAQKTGRLVMDARHIGFAYGDHTIVRDVSLTVQRGDRVGIMGPNGCGKTTLLSLLTGNLAPTTGTIRFGTSLVVCYFDQLRAELNETASVWENVCGSGDTVEINGTRRHVVGYLRDFLFPADRVHSPVSSLSGGERNRLMLAKLFTRPSNVLVFDEPTNDLDITTLELLEELLGSYEGTLLLVSHDRAFLDNVVTCTLALEPDGTVREYSGGFAAWLEERRRRDREQKKALKQKKTLKSNKPKVDTAVVKKRLGYKEKLELDTLPSRIESLELQREQLTHSMANPAVFSKPGEIVRIRDELAKLEHELEMCYARWETLESPESAR